MVCEEYYNYEEIAKSALEFTRYGKIVTIVDYYDGVKRMLHYILSNSNLDIEAIELASPNFDGYSKEFILTIDNRKNIWVEKAYADNKYLGYESDVVFISAGASLKALALLQPADVTSYSVTNV